MIVQVKFKDKDYDKCMYVAHKRASPSTYPTTYMNTVGGGGGGYSPPRPPIPTPLRKAAQGFSYILLANTKILIGRQHQ